MYQKSHLPHKHTWIKGFNSNNLSRLLEIQCIENTTNIRSSWIIKLGLVYCSLVLLRKYSNNITFLSNFYCRATRLKSEIKERRRKMHLLLVFSLILIMVSLTKQEDSLARIEHHRPPPNRELFFDSQILLLCINYVFDLIQFLGNEIISPRHFWRIDASSFSFFSRPWTN